MTSHDAGASLSHCLVVRGLLVLLTLVTACSEQRAAAPVEPAGAGTGGEAPSPGGSGGGTLAPPAGGGGGGATAGFGGTGGTDGDAGAVTAGTGGSGGGDVPDASVDAGPVITPPMGNPFVYVGRFLENEVLVFELDMETGALEARGSVASGPSPAYMAFHPSRRFAYALNEVSDGRVVAFAIDGETGALTRLNDASSGGSGPAHISMHKSGKWLLSSNYTSGHVAALPIGEDGRLGEPVSPVQAGAQAHMIVDDGASGEFVFVPSKGDDWVAQFRLNATTGVLVPNAPAVVNQAGAPRHMAFHSSGLYAFLLTERGRSLVSYRYDPATGLLSDPELLPLGETGNGAHVKMHPEHDVLYASLRGNDSIEILGVNAQGRAQVVGNTVDGMATPWDFDIDARGRYMLVANYATDSITVHEIGEGGTTLTRVGDGASVPSRPRFVGILYPP